MFSYSPAPFGYLSVTLSRISATAITTASSLLFTILKRTAHVLQKRGIGSCVLASPEYLYIYMIDNILLLVT